MGQKADPKLSAGARLERKATRAHLRSVIRQLETGVALSPVAVVRGILDWTLKRSARYDKAPGGLGRLAVLCAVGLTLLAGAAVLAAPPPDSHLPAAVCATLTQERAKYPTPPSHDQMGAMLNTTAWVHRADGWGLSKKTTGNVCPSVAGSIACDVLMLPSGAYWDVFIASGEATTVSCGVQSGTIPPAGPRGYLAPKDPGGTTTPPPVDPPPSGGDCSAEKAQIGDLRKQVAALTTENQRLYDHALEWDKRLNECLVEKDALQQKYDKVSCKASIFGVHIPCTVIK